VAAVEVAEAREEPAAVAGVQPVAQAQVATDGALPPDGGKDNACPGRPFYKASGAFYGPCADDGAGAVPGHRREEPVTGSYSTAELSAERIFS